MTHEEEMALRELAAKPHYLPMVAEQLGSLSLWSKDGLDRELEKARQEEREACAKICDEVERRFKELLERFLYELDAGGANGASQCAQQIRARGRKC